MSGRRITGMANLAAAWLMSVTFSAQADPCPDWPAERLALARVVEVLEGPVAMTDCMAHSCDLEASCIIQTGIGRVTRNIRNVLEGMTVAELLPAQPETPLAV